MIYFLEDDDNIRELVVYSLSKTGTPACGFPSPSEFYRAVENELPELILLDIMLPEESGLDVLRKIRAGEKTSGIPVIMLTAKGTELDKVRALDEGADDYITKPFGVMELAARVKAVLRRSEGQNVKPPEGENFECGGITVSVPRHKVTANGVEIALTNKEFELLCYLLKNRGVVVDRERILNSVWGYDFDGESRTVDVHIRTLRQKLGDCGSMVETVRGVGYRIAE